MELIKLIKFKLIEIIQLIKIIQKNKKNIYKIASCHHGSDITILQQYSV